MKKLLTIFTPTYNRGYILHQLYNSLLLQTNINFQWLIVDDGSTDTTKELVEKWISENRISIKYIYQENAGKMQAHNKGVECTDTELFVCVDSDDYLVDDSVDKIINVYKKIEKDDTVIGIVGYRGDSNGKVLGKNSFPTRTCSNLRSIYEQGFRGDTTLVFKTELLKQFRFPIIRGEKFISESYIYDQIDQDYNYYVVPEIFIVCTYREDGYTRNMEELLLKNPKGTLLVANQRMNMPFGFKTRILAAANYQYYSWIIGKKKYIREASNKMFLLLSFPVGVYFYLKRKRNEKRIGR